MSFFRKLFGGSSNGNGKKQAGRRPRPSSPAPPEQMSPGSVPPGPVRLASTLPTLVDLPPRRLHSYFEYVGGGSSKFYAVSVEEDEAETWRVRFNFGRIGFPRAWDTRVEAAPWPKAARVYQGLIDEKLGKGYEIRPWPANLKLPDGATLDDDASDAAGETDQVLSRASRRGTLPPANGGSVAGIALPEGALFAPMPEGGSRGEAPVIWASVAPVANVGGTWARLAAAFPETGLWPFVIDASFGFHGFDDYLMDMPRGRHTEVIAILRRGWNQSIGDDEDYPDEEMAPFGKQFPGLAERTPGERPKNLDAIVASATGHLGLVALNRPADVLDAVGWMGAANYDGDPLDMTTVLRSWEVRFDAYVVGMSSDTLTLAVGRPPRDLTSATAIAAEHFAFCPDNIQQGAGSIREYANLLVNERLWPFWWD